MNHEEFLKQVALGDREAFHQLYLETGRSVYSFILSILKNPQDAEEVLQETYHCKESVLYEISGSETHGRRGTG